MQIQIAVNYGDAIAILRWVLLWTINIQTMTGYVCMCVCVCNGCLNIGFSKCVYQMESLENCGFQIAIVLQRAIFISLLLSSVYIPIALSLCVRDCFCYSEFWMVVDYSVQIIGMNIQCALSTWSSYIWFQNLSCFT